MTQKSDAFCIVVVNYNNGDYEFVDDNGGVMDEPFYHYGKDNANERHQCFLASAADEDDINGGDYDQTYNYLLSYSAVFPASMLGKLPNYGKFPLSLPPLLDVANIMQL